MFFKGDFPVDDWQRRAAQHFEYAGRHIAHSNLAADHGFGFHVMRYAAGPASTGVGCGGQVLCRSKQSRTIRVPFTRPEQGETHIPIQTLIQRSGTSPRMLFQTPPFSDQGMQYLKIDGALGIRSIPVPCKVFSTCSDLWELDPSRPSGSSVRSRPSGSDSIGT